MEGGFTLRFATDTGQELLFAVNPESEERRFLVMIGKQGVTLDREDAAALFTWIGARHGEIVGNNPKNQNHEQEERQTD